MRFCSDCGANLPDDAFFCMSCGAPVPEKVKQAAPEQPVYVNIDPVQPNYPPQFPQYPNTQPAAENVDPYPVNVTHRGFWWLGFLVPVLGLVLHIVWKRPKPRLSRSIGKGALVGVIVQSVTYTIFYVIYFIAIASLGVLSDMAYYI